MLVGLQDSPYFRRGLSVFFLGCHTDNPAGNRDTFDADVKPANEDSPALPADSVSMVVPFRL